MLKRDSVVLCHGCLFCCFMKIVLMILSKDTIILLEKMLNLIAGGGRVLAIFIWKTINVIYILIEKYSQNSSKKRDCYSIAALVEIGLALSLFFYMVTSFVDILYSLLDNFSIIKEQTYLEKMVYINKINLNLSSISIMKEAKVFFVIFFSLIVFMVMLGGKAKRGYYILVYEAMQIILFAIFFKETRYIILFMVAI